MTLPKLFWRRLRCKVCGRLFELPLDADSLPVHTARQRGDDGPCPGRLGVPA